jgi:LysR family transcriptional regulator for bpeEF and oprC
MFRLGTNQVREWEYRKNGVEHSLLPRAALSFSDAQSAVTAAISGAGFVHSLDFTVEAQIASDLLQPVLQDWNAESYRAVSVVYPQHRQPTAKVKAFIDFVAGLFPQAAALPAATQSSNTRVA